MISTNIYLFSVYQTRHSSVVITNIPDRKIYNDNKKLEEGCTNSSLKWLLAQIWYGFASKPVRRNIIYTYP